MSGPAPEGRDFLDPADRAALLASPSTPEYPSVFPIDAYAAWLDRLRERGVEFVTYDDLFAHSDDRDHEHGYPREWAGWRARRDPARIQVLVQHDVDFVPRFADRMLALEADRGVRSNVFVFRELARDFPPGSPYDDTSYDLDLRFLRGAAGAGFTIGYHQNVVPRCDGTLAGAQRLFREDVAELRRHFAIRFFCPHGGRGATIDGRELRNHDVPPPDDLRASLRWVYNRHALRWSGRWSDGGLRRLEDPERLDALDLLDGFTTQMRPGNRYFVLVHPQLWGRTVDPDYNPALATRPWYRALLRRHGA